MVLASLAPLFTGAVSCNERRARFTAGTPLVEVRTAEPSRKPATALRGGGDILDRSPGLVLG